MNKENTNKKHKKTILRELLANKRMFRGQNGKNGERFFGQVNAIGEKTVTIITNSRWHPPVVRRVKTENLILL